MSTNGLEHCLLRRPAAISPADATASHWRERLIEFLPDFLNSHPRLRPIASAAAMALHGSTAMGVDDDGSDLDIWLALDKEQVWALNRGAGTGFFGFDLNGKAGHLNAESWESLAARIEHCDMDLIFQLRRAVLLRDPCGAFGRLIESAWRPMRRETRDALFQYHYVEMRGEHRSCDNPLARGDAMAALLAVGKTLGHALRAAMVLDGEPYPYDKWLYRMAVQTKSGGRMAPYVDAALEALESGALHRIGSHKDNPIDRALNAIRAELIRSAQAAGLSAPWLYQWWLYIPQSREAQRTARWATGD
ncbi:MAG: hypothetical protein BWZ10_02999 [candidate division BRC1 bacterium ADurb.BinA364]|nr:MAG: hypothetical protein BWZ10_02999 [candidate division BRC1 bacterium ADurb.BinA364]